MLNDKSTKIQDIKNILLKFRDERDWGQFHDPKNLAEAISIEAGELQEKFLWHDVDSVIEKINSDPKFREEIEEEFADVVIFAINFANAVGIDIAKAVQNKINKNSKKYPVNKAKGTARKYNKL